MPHSISTPPPAVFSTPRIATLFTSLLVSLASGTNYVFSAYGPQLSSRLHLSHTQQNIVGLAGNIGVYSTAPIWGRIVDTKGPKPLLVLGFVSLLIGYNGIRFFYDAGLPEGVTDLSLIAFCTLVVCSFLTGIGGNGGLASAMNATAKSFPDGARATVTGLVISGFGLSAFLFSSIAHVIFPGNTSDFLLLLAIGTSLPMVLGFFFIRPIPLPHHEYSHVPDTIDETDDAIFSVETPPPYRGDHSRTNLLDSSPDAGSYVDEEEELDEVEDLSSRSPIGYVPTGETGVALSPARTGTSRHRSRSSFSSRHREAGKVGAGVPNVRGKALAVSKMFWVLFVTTSLLSGTGLMYINNVGSISQALFAKGDPEFDEKKASQWQATQVSAVSIANCLGRVFIGVVADFTKNNLHKPRSWCMVLVSSMFIVSQVAVYNIDDVRNLWKGSALLGLAYGGLFGLFPTLVIEWFGLAHFSENWGFVSLSPLIGGNVFSIAFGRNLDAHAPSEPQDALTLPNSDASHQCLLGRECYASSLLMTIAACSTALLLSLYAGWRDYRQAKRELHHRHPQGSVLWDAGED
ncbi:major facilitator superfamily domain-containing protein [Irpex rosettiformis]|uniref:Major facilitator superfamily domain-containing protein n=1 Tax=Irpex rosettiformis TaxID=378272 RepID=A0ACB8UFS1_9APHY|nr:major facilitator superfamily domain-containing protein [Irpex rosettiformis]